MAAPTDATPDDAHVSATLETAEAHLAWLEYTVQQRRESFDRSHKSLERIRRLRHRGDSVMWDPAQRAALRIVVLAVGCVLAVAGAATLDPAAGGAAIVASFAVLLAEAIR